MVQLKSKQMPEATEAEISFNSCMVQLKSLVEVHRGREVLF